MDNTHQLIALLDNDYWNLTNDEVVTLKNKSFANFNEFNNYVISMMTRVSEFRSKQLSDNNLPDTYSRRFVQASALINKAIDDSMSLISPPENNQT